MLCENKLTNLVFKNQGNSAKTTQNEIHECYAMQILEKKKKTKTTKHNGHKELSNEA